VNHGSATSTDTAGTRSGWIVDVTAGSPVVVGAEDPLDGVCVPDVPLVAAVEAAALAGTALQPPPGLMPLRTFDHTIAFSVKLRLVPSSNS
jgi:hypothetical protein